MINYFIVVGGIFSLATVVILIIIYLLSILKIIKL